MSLSVCINLPEKQKKLFLENGESFFWLILREGLFDTANCGGRGTCGRCVIQVLEGIPLPKPAERKFFTPQELRNGYRLACLFQPKTDCVVKLLFEKKQESFVLDAIPEQMKPLGKSDRTEQGKENTQFIVTDLGTTTIVMQLIDGHSGRIRKTFHAQNPQRRYGADVISRIQAAKEGEAQELERMVKAVLTQGIHELGGHPQKMFLAGNTTMIHLLMGYSVEGLAKEPFQPVDITQINTIIAGVETVILPGFSAFVGGDIFAGIYTVQELEQEKGEVKKPLMLIDLGTNGEMALLTQTKIFVTATAAGPAFEGGATANVFGADMVSVMADLLQMEAVDTYGTLREPYFSKGIQVGKVYVRQEDIRSLQLAKAAVRAGIEVLLSRAKITQAEIEKVYLAGGFGYKLDCKKAGRIGLLPEGLLEKTFAAGNTALAGAYLYGSKGAEKQKIKISVESINLAKEENFEALYLSYLNF